MEITDIRELDDYSTASEYLVEFALTSGNGKMLRAINTLMTQASRISAAEAGVVSDGYPPKETEGGT